MATVLVTMATVMVTMAVAFLMSAHAQTDAEDLSKKLKKLATDALGKDYIQEIMDEHASFNSIKIHERDDQGRQFITELADKLSARFRQRIDAVKNIRQAIVDNYSSFKTNAQYTDTHPQCCEVVERDLEYNSNLAKKVDLHDICYRVSADSPDEYIIPANNAVYKAMKHNANKIADLKWQYFGTEQGIHVTFPSRLSGCSSYDPRVRPWYVETATPQPKDLVIIIDKSGSMTNHNRMNITKEAAITVVKTLNPNDRVGIVAFSSLANTPSGNGNTNCYHSELAYATPDNLRYLSSYINSIKAKDETNYLDALDKAFSLMANTGPATDESMRNKAMLFLTDGVPSSGSNTTILKKIADLNAMIGNKVLIMTYGLGEEIDDDARNLLRDMAKQVSTNWTDGIKREGQFTEVTSTDNLRFSLGSYYNQFSDETQIGEAKVTVPYSDFSGLGLVSSICDPVHYQNDLIGVACVDVRINDIIGDIAFYQHGEYAYTFIIDGTGRTLIHPLMPQPQTYDDEATFLDISGLEREQAAQEVIASMKKGESSSKRFKIYFVQGRGNVTKQGVKRTYMQATYQWKPVAGTNFSVCMVFADKDKQLNISTVADDNAENFLYARFDLKRPTSPCNLLNKLVTTESSSVLFTKRAFDEHYRGVGEDPTRHDIDDMTNYMQDSNYDWKWLKHGIRSTVVVSERMDRFWIEQNEDFAPYMLWRYTAFYNGVFRTYPGFTLPIGYDHATRPWYDTILANRDDIVLTTPYVDAFGAGIVTTLGHTILEGIPNVHSDDDMVIGAVGVDFKLAYLHGMMNDVCNTGESEFCFLISNTGFVIYHPELLEEGADVSNVHVTKLEPDVAYYLIENNFMTQDECVGLGDKRLYRTWTVSISLPEVGDMDAFGFILQKVRITNVFMVRKKRTKSFNAHCSCGNLAVSECTRIGDKICECPCYSSANYAYCKNTFLRDESDKVTCTAPKPPVFTKKPLENEADLAKQYDKCFDINCQAYTSESICNVILHCRWCNSSGPNGITLSCHDPSTCTVTDPPGGGGDPATTPAEGPVNYAAIGGGVAGVLVVIIIIIIAVVVLCRRTRSDNEPQYNRNEAASTDMSMLDSNSPTPDISYKADTSTVYDNPPPIPRAVHPPYTEPDGTIYTDLVIQH